MSAQRVSCARTTNSRRRPGRPLGPAAVAIREHIASLTDRYARMTVRQVFYALEVAGIVANTEGGYRQVQTQVLKMRREWLLAWEFITDGTRWRRKPETWGDIDAAIADLSQAYRRDLWQSQNLRIEVWLEKDALADVVVDVTSAWDVPLMVSRGQSSATFLWSSAMSARRAWEAAGVATVILALYDRDAGGRRAFRTIAKELPAHVPGVPVTVELLGVTDEQVEAWDLPTRPAKKSDPEAATFEGPAVELDAIAPDKLVALVGDAIEALVDQRSWAIEQAVEAEERAGLELLLQGGPR